MLDVSAVVPQLNKIDTYENFKNEVKLATKLYVILFVSRSAPESLDFQPQFQDIQKDRKLCKGVEFAYVSADTNQETAKELEVTEFPTVLFYMNNNQVEKLVNPTLEDLQDVIDNEKNQDF